MENIQIDNNIQLIAEKTFYLTKDMPFPPAIGFCSATHGEGTTTVLTRIAIAANSENNRKLLMIDTCKDGGLSQIFGKKGCKGLRDMAAGQAKASKIILECSSPGLFLVPAGTAPLNPGPSDVETLLKDSGTEWDAIFFDLPAVLSSVTAMEFATYLNALIMIVEAHTTRKETIMLAKEELEASAPGKLKGCLMNKRKYIIPQVLYNLL